ncbi:MAG: peptide deformylase [Pseudomonadota bacterium]
MPRPFLLWPDPRLKAVAAPVAGVDDAVRAIWAEMLEAMYAMPGVGLAAPQLGIGLRLAVVDAGTDPGAGRAPVRLANPEILAHSEETLRHREGSPNLPGLAEEVARPARVRLRYLDATGAVAERWFDGLWAISAQHQVDHLDGKLFIDRLSPMRRRRALEQWRKSRRQRARR